MSAKKYVPQRWKVAAEETLSSYSTFEDMEESIAKLRKACPDKDATTDICIREFYDIQEMILTIRRPETEDEVAQHNAKVKLDLEAREKAELKRLKDKYA